MCQALSLSLSLSLCLSLFLFLFLCLSLSVFLSLSFSLSLCVRVCVCVCVCVCVHVHKCAYRQRDTEKTLTCLGPTLTVPPTWRKRVRLQPRNPNRCSSDLVTRKSPLQGNPGEHTAHWARLKIILLAFSVTPEVKIHPTRGFWLFSPPCSALSIWCC